MKSIKFLAAILAITFVLGSAFSKPTFTDNYAILTEGSTVSGHTDFKNFTVVKLSDLSDWDCGVENIHPCTFTLDETHKDVEAPFNDYSSFNFLEFSQDDEVRTVQLKVTGTSPAILSQSSNGQIVY